jgi:hypothetical protein
LGIDGWRLPIVYAAGIRVIERHIRWNRWPAKPIEWRAEVAAVALRVIKTTLFAIPMATTCKLLILSLPPVKWALV